MEATSVDGSLHLIASSEVRDIHLCNVWQYFVTFYRKRMLTFKNQMGFLVIQEHHYNDKGNEEMFTFLA